MRDVDIHLLEHRYNHRLLLHEERGEEVKCRYLIVPALDGELVRPVNGFFGFCRVVVEWCHTRLVECAFAPSGVPSWRGVSRRNQSIAICIITWFVFIIVIETQGTLHYRVIRKKRQASGPKDTRKFFVSQASACRQTGATLPRRAFHYLCLFSQGPLRA